MPTIVPPINKADLFSSFLCEAAVEYTSEDACLFRGVQGEIFFLLSKDHDSTYAIDIRVGGEWQQLAEGTLAKDELMIVDIAFYIPEARVRVTPSAINARLTVETFGYPTVFTRDRTGRMNS